MIKTTSVLFFSRNCREEVWEYDFILNDIELDKEYQFLSDNFNIYEFANEIKKCVLRDKPTYVYYFYKELDSPLEIGKRHIIRFGWNYNGVKE